MCKVQELLMFVQLVHFAYVYRLYYILVLNGTVGKCLIHFIRENNDVRG